MTQTAELVREVATAQVFGQQDAKVFVNDHASLQIIKSALIDIGIKSPSTQLGDVQTASATLSKTSSPRLLIVDISSTPEPIERLGELANFCDPDVNVIAVGEKNDIVLYRDLKNIGIIEYFIKPLVKDVVARICLNILNPGYEQPRMRTGKLIFVIGVRGGVGATTIASHVAWHLSESGRRVSLIDLDMKQGDASLQFDLTPNNALCEAIEFPDRVDSLFLDRAVQPVSERLHLLASQAPLSQNLPVTPEAIAGLLEKLASRYRYVVVDLPAHLAGDVVHSTLLPRICVLVSNATLSAARDLSRWREQMGANVPERSTIHVLNHCDPHGSLSDQHFVKAAGQSPNVTISYHRDLADAANLGFKEAVKCDAFSRSLKAILRPLTGEQAEASVPFYRRLLG